MEGIELEHFHALAQTETSATLQARKCCAVFHSFFSGDRKQNSDTTIAHSKHIIELF